MVHDNLLNEDEIEVKDYDNLFDLRVNITKVRDIVVKVYLYEENLDGIRDNVVMQENLHVKEVHDEGKVLDDEEMDIDNLDLIVVKILDFDNYDKVDKIKDMDNDMV